MTNLDIIKELYRCFREKDYPAFLAICQPELEWIQNKGFPGGAVHYGASNVVEAVFKSFNNEWRDWRFDIEEYIDAGDSIIVIGKYTGQHRTTDKALSAPAAHVYDLENGKVRRFRQFTDTKLIWDAMS